MRAKWKRVIAAAFVALLGLAVLLYAASACALLMGGPCRHTCRVTAELFTCRVPSYAAYVGFTLLFGSVLVPWLGWWRS